MQSRVVSAREEITVTIGVGNNTVDMQLHATVHREVTTVRARSSFDKSDHEHSVDAPGME